MKFVTSSLFLLLVSAGLHAAGPRATLVRVKMIVPSDYHSVLFWNFISGDAFPGYNSDMVDVSGKNKATDFSKELPGSRQIIFLGQYPLLINSGDNLQLVLTAAAKPGTGLVPSVTGKTGERVLLPYIIGTIYANGHNATTMQSREAVDAFIKAAEARVEKLIAKAGVTGQENKSLLRTFELIKQLELKYGFVDAHKESVSAADFADWYDRGFSIADPGLSGIGDQGFTGTAINEWWAGKKWKDPSLTDDMQITQLLENAKSNLLKDRFTSLWFKGEAGNYRFTPKLKRMYPVIKSALVAGSPGMYVVDSIYNYYKKLDAGQPAYNFSLKNPEGVTVHLSDFKGKMVVIDFWGTWCPACIATLPNFKQLEESYKGKDDIVFLHIAYEAPDTASIKQWKEFAASHDAGGPRSLITHDPGNPEDIESKLVFEGYCLKAFPCILAIDKDGNFLDNRLGYLNEPIVAEKIAAFYKQMH